MSVACVCGVLGNEVSTFKRFFDFFFLDAAVIVALFSFVFFF